MSTFIIIPGVTCGVGISLLIYIGSRFDEITFYLIAFDASSSSFPGETS
jgi:hypothetical protein